MKKSIYFLIILSSITLHIQAQNLPAYIPSNGLVGWWPFNASVLDESGNGNHVTNYDAGFTNDRMGNPFSACTFNGVQQYMQTLAIGPSGTSSRTFAFWMKTNSTAIQTAIDYSTSSGAFQSILNSPCPGLGVDVGSGVVTRGDASLINNQWHHCVLVFDQSTSSTASHVKVYIDGTLQSNISCFALNPNALVNTTNPGTIVFGKTASNLRYFNGALDDIGIWTRALTQQEITALYQAGFCTFSISSQPNTSNTTIGSNANFSVTLTTNCVLPTTLQWQTNLGFGWQSLQNVGQYSGVNTSTLQVMNVNQANTNQLFRCIASSGTTTDTSQTATLTLVGSNSNLSGITHAIPYQAVVRDINGNLLGNHPIKVRCTLHDSSASGTSIYRETHSLNTNNLGLFTLHIGSGTASIGNMDSVNWALNKKYIQIEVDTTSSGLSFIDLGTQQLMAVPYALYAETSGTALSGPKGDTGAQGVAGATGPQGLQGATGPQGPAGLGGFSHYIGEVFGGGVIFHLWKDSLGNEHGLIVDKIDLALNQVWSNITNTVIGISAESLWDGLSNSNAIVAQPGHTNSAAALCLNSTNGGQNDWYLPSIQELNILWSNYIDVSRSLSQISGSIPLTGSHYWSSTEIGNFVWLYSLGNGGAATGGKSGPFHIRAVRSF